MFNSRSKGDSKWRSEVVRNIPSEPGIYLIECTANGKKYVGATVNLHKRIIDHLANLAMGGKHHASFGDDYLNYGKDSFRVEVLEYVSDRSLLADREAYWHWTMNDDLCNIDPAKKHWRW